MKVGSRESGVRGSEVGAYSNTPIQNLNVITSTKNQMVKDALKLMDRRHRDETGRMLIEGLKELQLAVKKDIEFERLAGARKEMIVTISDHISNIKRLVNEMIEERKKANAIDDVVKKAKAYDNKVKPYLEEIREHIDKLELIVDNERWPLPKYRELLFTR